MFRFQSRSMYKHTYSKLTRLQLISLEWIDVGAAVNIILTTDCIGLVVENVLAFTALPCLTDFLVQPRINIEKSKSNIVSTSPVRANTCKQCILLYSLRTFWQKNITLLLDQHVT